MEKWSERAWNAALPIYRSIIGMPFVAELAAGTLPREKFMFYLRQDALYIDGYARNLAHTASRLRRKDHVESFVRFALDGVEVEQQMHSVFLSADEKPSADEMTPTCLLYSSLLRSMAMSPVEVEAAALLPCFWIYQRVGEEIARRSETDGNPYALWISTYGDEAFARSTARAIEICDDLAEATTESVRRQMTDIFLKCSRMEWMFWDSAYNLEKWKI